MKNTNNRPFAHRDTMAMDNFYEIMDGKKKILTKRQELDFEASYFAMCLLLPEGSLLQLAGVFGGINEVIKDNNKVSCLARVFRVEDKLVSVRINDLLSREKEQKKKVLNIFRQSKNSK